MSEGAVTFDKTSPKRLFILSLASPSFAIGMSNVFLNLFLLEVAATFQINEGVAVQLRTVNALAEIIFCLIIGLLATRFKHRSLLLAGTSLIIISAVGNSIASSFEMMLFFFLIEGTGSVIVAIMAFTLVGDLVALNKKAKVVSWITAAGYLTIFVGTPLITYIVGFGSWRYAFLLIVLPVSIAALALVFLGVPSIKSGSQKSRICKEIDFNNFKQIFSNKSALKCLFGNLFFTGPSSAIFIVAFFRQQFSLSSEGIVYITLIAILIIVLGCIFAGRIANKSGVKPLAVIGSIVSGIFMLSVFFAQNLWFALAFDFLNVWFSGMAMSACNCLALDQVPKSRSTMMSLSRLFGSLSSFMVAAVGGTLLVLFSSQSLGLGYQAVGIMFGATHIIAGILFFSAKDPYKNPSPSKPSSQSNQ